MADNQFLPEDPRYVFAPTNGLAQQPTWADAATWHGQNLADTWQAMQDPALWVDAARQYSNALMLGTETPGGIRAFHASPYDFNRFDFTKIGTGEGAQAYGYGGYFAGHEPVMEGYYDQFSRPQPPKALLEAQADYNAKYNAVDASMPQAEFDAAIKARDDAYARLQEAKKLPLERQPAYRYEVNIAADPEHMLDWDKPLSEQSGHVQDAVNSLEGLRNPPGSQTGANIVDILQNYHGNAAEAAQAIRDAGIPGIRYLDAGSRQAADDLAGWQRTLQQMQARGASEQEQGLPKFHIDRLQKDITSNYVVFDDNMINILRKYGIAGLGLAGTGAATQSNTTE